LHGKFQKKEYLDKSLLPKDRYRATTQFRKNSGKIETRERRINNTKQQQQQQQINTNPNKNLPGKTKKVSYRHRTMEIWFPWMNTVCSVSTKLATLPSSFTPRALYRVPARK
jgi:transcription initiation factor TFIID subunit TAF12